LQSFSSNRDWTYEGSVEIEPRDENLMWTGLIEPIDKGHVRSLAGFDARALTFSGCSLVVSP